MKRVCFYSVIAFVAIFTNLVSITVHPSNEPVCTGVDPEKGDHIVPYFACHPEKSPMNSYPPCSSEVLNEDGNSLMDDYGLERCPYVQYLVNTEFLDAFSKYVYHSCPAGNKDELDKALSLALGTFYYTNEDLYMLEEGVFVESCIEN